MMSAQRPDPQGTEYNRGMDRHLESKRTSALGHGSSGRKNHNRGSDIDVHPCSPSTNHEVQVDLPFPAAGPKWNPHPARPTQQRNLRRGRRQSFPLPYQQLQRHPPLRHQREK